MSERFYCPDLTTGERVVLDSAESHHVRDVMRAEIGDRVTLFDGRGMEAVGVVAELTRRGVALQVETVHAVSREPRRAMVLGVAPPRGGRERFLLEKAVELGVRRLVWLETARSVARPKSKPRRPSVTPKQQRAVIEASKQCGRNDLMQVESRPLAEYWTAPEWPAARWVADPRAEQFPPVAELAADEPVALAIGPEGGFAPDELESARAAGWRPVTLGPRILRVETAALALVARLILP